MSRSDGPAQIVGLSRSTQRRTLVVRDDEDALKQATFDLASEYGRYRYRRITALLRHQGWHVYHKRVVRIWPREGAESTAEATEAEPSVAQ